MRFALQLLTGPAIEPLTLDALKIELRIMTGTMEDAKLTRLLAAGRQWFEDRTALALVDQSWRLSLGPNLRFLERPVLSPRFDYYCGSLLLDRDRIWLRRSPLLAMVGVWSVAADGTRTEVSTDAYQLRDAGTKWPYLVGLSPMIGRDEELQIEYRAGYAERTGSPITGAEVIPAELTQPILLWIEAMYDRDKDMMDKLLKAASDLADIQSVNMNFA